MNWTPTQIRCALLLKGINLTDLSLQAGLDAHVCARALNSGDSVGEKIISDCLGISVQELWPERFDIDGKRKIAPIDTDIKQL